MKKILSVFLALVVLLSVIPLAVFALDKPFVNGWNIVEDYDYYDQAGQPIATAPFNGGNGPYVWSDSFYWTGFMGTPVHDSHGQGQYVTGEINGNVLRVYFGNNDDNCDTNAEIYVDGVLKKTYNLKNDGQGQINYAEVTLDQAGPHTVKVLAAGGNCGWLGFPFNCIAYQDTTVNYKIASEYKFYNADGTEVTPGNDGSSWGLFPHWTVGGLQGYEVNGGAVNAGNGAYVTTTLSCSAFRVVFANGDGNCASQVEISVDGQVVGTYSPAYAQTDSNSSQLIRVAPGVHEIKVMKVGGTEWQAMPFTCVQYVEAAPGSYRLVPLLSDAYYAAAYFYTGVNTKDTPINFSFYAKGRKGDTICIDLEGQQKNQVSYTFTEDYEWEFVSGTLEGASDIASPDPAKGYPFRVYTWQSSDTPADSVVKGYWIDDLSVGALSSDFTNSWPLYSWIGGSYVGFDANTDKDFGLVHTSIFDSKYVTAYKVEGQTVTAYPDVSALKKSGVTDDRFNDAVTPGTSHMYLNNDGVSAEMGLATGDSCFVEINFVGTACSVFTHYRCMGPDANPTSEYVTSNSIRVTLDGVDVSDTAAGELTAASMNNTAETAIASVSGLQYDEHTLKIENLDVEPGVILRWLHIDSIVIDEGQTKLPEAVISYADADENGKIDDLLIAASIKDDGKQYGIIIGEDNFATKTSMKLAKDEGNPLFTKYCDKYDAMLAKDVYDTAEISAVNLDGEIDDKIIALRWENMPAYGTFAARVFCIDGDEVMYGPISTVSLTEASSLLPLAE